ncbi:hypothetical protein RM697_11395 [Ichthyenterobacterium sp. W332]|uniref:Tetratricopeptide repeat protein n=1 Tax=Microcosmobacter mediterraneus TaxID=3075607 RepID=A0ABU2YNK0_9FLAO|nr:hypothetical protein [Ichthyenterobacterium sp. W332]MDT0559259.1 hypothetical protein [Ichthyenterobacterium sp. W332]
MKTSLLLLCLLIFSINVKAQNNTDVCNCCTETHAQFDFWIGEWIVTNPDGSRAGENTIDKIQDQCILRENWTSAQRNFTGTSYNFYNAQAKHWEQIWIDNKGGNLHLKGHRKDNQMILKTDKTKNSEGVLFYHQVTWTKNKDGSVRQLWETFTEGQDVVIAFDGLYRKR